jgi:nitroimidazol reductase NimA-like FMN-containing flavoprotein (pyridoxamine 5'-phosphate oxidase superfamily)
MAREHADIKMTPEELHEFLGSDRRLVLATLAADDSPWGDVVAYAYVDRRVYFRVPAGTRSAENIGRDRRVCCVVESKPANSSYYDIKGAILHGTVTEARTDGDAAALDALASIPDPMDPAGPAGTTYWIGTDDSTSFVFAKIRGRYEDRSVTDIQQDAGITA